MNIEIMPSKQAGQGGQEVEIYQRKQSSLHDIIERDCKFFHENNKIDYSFLVGEIEEDQVPALKKKIEEDPSLAHGVYYSTNGKAYVLGIIDILRPWNCMYNTYYNFKRIQHGDTMSVVPPNIY